MTSLGAVSMLGQQAGRAGPSGEAGPCNLAAAPLHKHRYQMLTYHNTQFQCRESIKSDISRVI